jgi:serine/threonine protein kinase
MPAPTTVDELLELVRKSGVVDEKRVAGHMEKLRADGAVPPDATGLAAVLVRDGILTHFQAEQFLLGKWRRFTVGKYKVLERLGSGGMGSVYLCEHKLMRRRVAVKVLPTAKADDPAALERFYRESRAVAALDHPNIVRAYDIDQDDKLHFLVMEYVDGASLQEIVKKNGPMDVLRATHYIRQAALGLQHAHEKAGLVHRDIKPGNILVDRNGVVKVLDMGLARFFHDEEDILTKKYDENVLGTADYLAPEQALDSHGVDIRADIYSLGATFYFCLAGRTPFAEGTIAQKLIWHQTRQPKSIRTVRPEIPEGLAAVLEKMMAKDPAQRYQVPLEAAEALSPFTQTPIPPPPEAEMPQLSPAAMGNGLSEPGSGSGTKTSSGEGSGSRRQWQVPTPASPRPSSASGPPARPARDNPARGPSPQALVPPAASEPRPVPQLSAAAPGQAKPGAAPAAGLSGPHVESPSVLPAEEEGPPDWEKLAADTSDSRASAKTTPRTTVRRSARPRRSPRPSLGRRWSRRLADLRSSEYFWWIVGAVAALLLILLALTLLAFLAPTAVLQSEEDKPRHTLFVNRAGGPTTFTRISDAVAAARPFDVILVQDETITDADIRIAKKPNLSIVAEPGKTVLWKCPERASDGAKLLTLTEMDGFELKGFTLDGGNRVDTLIGVFDRCPGLTLQDVTLRNFKKYGVLVSDSQGTPEKPIRFAGVKFITNEKDQTGLFFQLTRRLGDITKDQHIVVNGDCTFTGSGTAVKTPNAAFVEDVTLPANVNLAVGQ